MQVGRLIARARYQPEQQQEDCRLQQSHLGHVFALLSHLLLPFLEPSDCRWDAQPHHLLHLSHGHSLHSGLPGGGFRAAGMVHTGYQQPELASQLSCLCVLPLFPFLPSGEQVQGDGEKQRSNAVGSPQGELALHPNFELVRHRATRRLYCDPASNLEFPAFQLCALRLLAFQLRPP